MWCLAAVSLLAAALPAGAAADVPLGPPINVPVDGSKAYSPPLTAGVTYRVVATGTYTKTKVSTGQRLSYDAAYCFDEQPARVGGCTRLAPVRTQRFIVRFEGDPSYPFLDALNPATQLPYNDISHRYEETFTATRSGRIEAYEFDGGSGIYTQQGNITLELFGPAPAPPTGPSGGGSPGAEKPPTVLPSAKWGKPGPPTALGPGDEAIAPGPKIASGQTQASVTVNSNPPGQTPVVALGVPSGKDTNLKKLTRGDCVRAAVAFAKPDPATTEVVYDADIDDFVDRTRPEESSDEALLAAIFLLIACLDYVDELEKQPAIRATASVVGAAARSSCRPSRVPLKTRVDRAAGTIAYSVRRASRRDPARRLRVSCRLARDGTMTMRIRTRSRRTKLRKVLGKRLVVGVHRPRAATGTANVRTTFKRR